MSQTRDIMQYLDDLLAKKSTPEDKALELLSFINNTTYTVFALNKYYTNTIEKLLQPYKHVYEMSIASSLAVTGFLNQTGPSREFCTAYITVDDVALQELIKKHHARCNPSSNSITNFTMLNDRNAAKYGKEEKRNVNTRPYPFKY